jgi:hypothetical protein
MLINSYKIVVKKTLKRRDHLELGVNCRYDIKMDLKRMVCEGAGFIRQVQEAKFCERNNEPSGSMKGGEYLGQLSNYQLLKLDPALWSSSFI